MAFNCSSDPVILKDTFYTFPAPSVSCNLILTEKFLLIDFRHKNKCEEEKILLSDIIGCHTANNKVKTDFKDIYANFCIYAYPLKTSAGILSKQRRRERRAQTFQTRTFETLDENINLVDKWQKTIVCLIKGIPCFNNGKVYIPDTIPPANKFLVLVNPRSGSGKAYHIFKERVAPILAESSTLYDLLTTDRANCARDYVKKADLSQWNGIVVVSGDGLLFEVYNGLMSRSDWREAVKIPVGVVPGGSGNGLARAINYAADEPYDVTVVTSSVLNVVRGRVAPMDLVKVQTANECFYSFLSVGWGLMADIDIESERLRPIGEARFAVWAVIRTLSLRKYKGRLSYLPVSGYQSNHAPKVVSEPKPKRSKTLESHLAWAASGGSGDYSILRSKSFGAHDPEFDEEDSRTVRLLKFSYSGEELDEHFVDKVPSLGEKLYAKDLPHDHCDDAEITDLAPEFEVPRHYCPPFDSAVPHDWVVLEDEFVLVYVCHQTHLSTDVFFAPDAKLDDGIMWLILIKANVTRAQVMYFLSCLQTGDHVHIPYVEVIPIHAFRLEPFSSDGFLTVDGEVIPCCTIQAEVFPSVARIMSR